MRTGLTVAASAVIVTKYQLFFLCSRDFFALDSNCLIYVRTQNSSSRVCNVKFTYKLQHFSVNCSVVIPVPCGGTKRLNQMNSGFVLKSSCMDTALKARGILCTRASCFMLWFEHLLLRIYSVRFSTRFDGDVTGDGATVASFLSSNMYSLLLPEIHENYRRI